MVVLYYALGHHPCGTARSFAHGGHAKRTMRKDRNERQERKAAQREAAERQKRRTALIWRGVVALVVLGIAAYGYRSYTQRRLLQDVATANYPAGMHVAGRIDYTETPPMGGAHNVVWQNCGIYGSPIHNEHAVHSLEHGAVWITYRPDLAADQVQTLRAIAADDFMLLSPYPGLPAPVVVSAWNHQTTLDGAHDPRLAAFVSQYRNNPQTTPEFGAPCAGGIATTAVVDTLTTASAGMTR